MRSELIRRYKTVHTWAGIVTGLALFIAFYAGAITIFKEPLARWIAPPTEQLAPLAQAETLIAQTLAARPDAAKEFTLHLRNEENVPARLTWEKKRPKGSTDSAPWSATVDAEGALRISQLHPSGLPQFIDILHRTAGVPGDLEIGEQVMGVVSIVYAVALISGLIVLLPSLVKDFFALRLGKNLKRMWLDAHNVIGIASLPFHLIMAMTAVVFCLHDYLYDAQDAVIYGGQLRPIMKASSPAAAGKNGQLPAAMLPPAQLLAEVRQFAPGFAVETMQYRNANTADAQVRISGQDPRYLVRGNGFVQVNAVTGKILNSEYLPGRQGNWSATVSSFFALHFGSYGGAPVRWSYFLLGLAGAFLFYSGNLLWLETRRRRERKEGGPVSQSPASRYLAAGTVGVCLGCISGISLSIVAGKWLHGHVADLNAWHRAIYYTVFLGSIAWAFRRGAASAASELLWLAAAAAAAIPLTSLAAWLLPALGMWSHGSDAALGVDAVAAIAAACFAWMARATRRRARRGPRDSVWSASKAPTTAEA